MPGESQEIPKSGVPDPSVLTTEQMLREVERAKELMDSELRGLKGVLDEKFNTVTIEFGLIERQRVEQKNDTAAAVAAALAAAKEAVAEQTEASERNTTKSETATAEQLKQLNTTFTQAIAGVVSALNDVKDRVRDIEANKRGGQESRATVVVGITLAALVVGVVLAAVGFVIGAGP